MRWEIASKSMLKHGEQNALLSLDALLGTANAADPKIERFLALKSTIHRKLLDRINLAMLDKLSRAQVAEEVGEVVLGLLAQEDEALNASRDAGLQQIKAVHHVIPHVSERRIH